MGPSLGYSTILSSSPFSPPVSQPSSVCTSSHGRSSPILNGFTWGPSPHFVINPESHFHPVVHRDIQPAVPHSNRGTIYEEFHVVEDLTRPHEGAHPAPRAKQASRSTAPRSVMIPEEAPPARSSKRPRIPTLTWNPTTPDREQAPSPTPTVPGHVPSTHIPATESTHSTPNPLDPAIADHRNRPWPPADDRTLIRLFVGRWIPNLVLPGKPSQVE